MEKRLRHIVAEVLLVVALAVLQAVGDVLERGLELIRFLVLRHRCHQRGDGAAVHRLPETAEAAAVGHAAVLARAAAHVLQSGVDDLVRDLHARVSCREQPHQHRACDRGVCVCGVRHVPPSAPAIVFLRGAGAADGEIQRLCDATHRFFTLPQQRLVHRTVGLGQGQHGKAVVVHAVWQITGGCVLAADHRPQRPADVWRVTAKVRLLTTSQKRHEADAIDPRAALPALPVALLTLF